MDKDLDTEPDGQPLPAYEMLPMLTPVGLEIGTPKAVAALVEDLDVVGLGPERPGIDNVGIIPAPARVGNRRIWGNLIVAGSCRLLQGHDDCLAQ